MSFLKLWVCFLIFLYSSIVILFLFLKLHVLHPDEIKQKVEAKLNELGDV